MEAPFQSNARIFQPKYLVRHLLYQDHTRQRAYLQAMFKADDRYIDRYSFGKRIETQSLIDAGSPIEYFTVANYPSKVSVEYPAESGQFITQVDICFAPTEQWMLYEHALPEDINPNPEIISMGLEGKID